MRSLRAFILRLGAFFQRDRWENELDAELASNLELHIEDNLRAGMTPEQARADALKRFGGIAAAKDAYRDRKLLPSFDSLVRDSLQAFRMVLRSPGSSLAIVVLLGVGLGANAAVFSLMNAVLLRPLPAIDDPGSLVVLARNWQHRNYRRTFSYPAYLAAGESLQSFSNIAAHQTSQFVLSADGWTEWLMGEYITPNYFDTLGVQPVIGRVTIDANERAVVISYRLWQSHFGGATAVIGKSVVVRGEAMVIAGVAEKDFRGVYLPGALDLFVPIRTLSAETLGRTDSDFLRIIGRPRAGVTLSQTQAELVLFSDRWNSGRPENERLNALAEEYNSFPGSPGNRANVMRLFDLLVAVTAIAVFVTCANVTNLMLARAASRSREIAVRAAIGAGRARLIRQALIEGLALSFAGATLSLVIAVSVVPQLARLLPPDDGMPVTLDFAPDWRVATYAALMALIAALAFALPPALRATRWDIWRVLRSGESAVIGGRSRMRSILVISQVAFCFVLLAGSGLLLRSLHLLDSIDIGLTRSNVILAAVDPDLNRSGQDLREQDPDSEAWRLHQGDLRRLYSRLLDRIRAIPGVEAVAFAVTVPLTNRTISIGDVHGGVVAEQAAFFGNCNIVTPSYFETLAIPILRGRAFESGDNENAAPVAIVNESLARKLWPDGDAIGQILFVGGSAQGTARRIVGIARDISDRLRAPTRELYYLPYAQDPRSASTLHVRTSIETTALLPALRQAVADIDPLLPIFQVRTIEDVKLQSYWTERLFASIVGFSALVSILLASLGLYAVMLSRVTHRTREIGIRMALGASSAGIRTGVIWESARLCLIGIAIGTGLAFAGTRVLSTMLYGVTPTDPLTFTAALVILAIVAWIASYLPARRATRIDPLRALRCD